MDVAFCVVDFRQEPLLCFEPDVGKPAYGDGVTSGVVLLYQLGTGSSIELCSALSADPHFTFILSSSW